MRKVWEYLRERGGLSNLLVLCLGIVFYLLLENLDIVRGWVTALMQVASPVLWGGVIAYLLDPLASSIANRLLRKLKNRKTAWRLGVLCAVVIALGLLGLLLVGIMPELLSSMSVLIMNAGIYFSSFKRTLTAWAALVPMLEIDVEALIGSWSAVFTSLSYWIRENIQRILNASVKVGSGVLGLFTSLILSIYILLDKPNLMAGMRRWGRSFLGDRQFTRTQEVVRMTHSVFASYLSASLTDALVVGFASFVFMSAFLLPYPLLFSTLLGLSSIVPVFGPIAGAVCCGLMILIIKPVAALWFMVGALAILMVDAYLIRSRIFTDPTRLSPLWVLVAIVLGARFFGFVGVVIGVPLMDVIARLIHQSVDNLLLRKGIDPATAGLPEETATPPAGDGDGAAE